MNKQPEGKMWWLVAGSVVVFLTAMAGVPKVVVMLLVSSAVAVWFWVNRPWR
jgi:hypothetical protein